MEKRYDVFISYSRYDADVVNAFVDRLEREGFSVWIDRAGIESGDAFKKIILQAIKNSAVILFFSSQFSNQSGWTAKEIGVAVKYKKPVIPILLDGSNFNEEVEFDLINLDFIDYQDVTVRGIMMDRLVKSLKTKITNPIGQKKAEEALLKAEAAERERLEQEQRKKEEAERKTREEAERQAREAAVRERAERERKAEEAKRKVEQERRERERAEVQRRAEMERSSLNENDGQPKPKKGLWIALGAVAALVLLLVLLWPKPKPEPEQQQSQQQTTKNVPTEISSISSTGYAYGHEYVDLGLPGGTLWATCNIGASKPESYGNYYAWGETEPKDGYTYDWSSYRYANYNGLSQYCDKLTKYCNSSSYGNNGFTDNLIALQSGDDPAFLWGNGWRTPTKAQWDELLDNTTNQGAIKNGVSGRLFTSEKNGNMLFLPASGVHFESEFEYSGSYGYYWSKSLDTDGPYAAWLFSFDSFDYCSLGPGYRCYGYNVRPVRQN